MATLEYSAGVIPSYGRLRFTSLTSKLASRGLPLLVGVILVMPLVMLLVNSVNVAPAGQAFRYGLGNWQAALADPAALSALWNSFALAITRTAISLPIALVLTWLHGAHGHARTQRHRAAGLAGHLRAGPAAGFRLGAAARLEVRPGQHPASKASPARRRRRSTSTASGASPGCTWPRLRSPTKSCC